VKQPKTIPWAVYPDGSAHRIIHRSGYWWWSHDSGSSSYAGAIENVESLGGRVERRPNPNYRRDPLPHYSRLMRSFGL